MPSEEDYGSDYDAIPEAGRAKLHLDSDSTSDDELSSSAPRRAPPFFNDDGDDDDDDDGVDTPLAVEETGQDHSAASSTSATANPIIRQPTAFLAPNPAAITSSSSSSGGGGPTFYGNNNSNNNGNSNNSNKTPDHVVVSADGTSMFCVEGYVNTPELSAGRGGGLSQGLPANGPYKSLFRARSESRGSNKLPLGTAAPAATATASVSSSAITSASSAAAIAPDAGLHVLAEAAQSPEAQSPVSAASPTPAPGSTHALPTAKKPRKPSPLVASPPASSVEPLQSISAATMTMTTTRLSTPSAVSTTDASPPHVMDYSSPPRPSQVRPRPSRAGGTRKGKQHKEKAPAPATPPSRRSSAQAAAATSVGGGGGGGGGSDGRRYERHSVPHQQLGRQPAFPTEHREATDFAPVPGRPRSLQKNRARLEEAEVSSVPPPPPPPPAPAPANDGSYDHAMGYYPAYYEIDPLDASNATAHLVHDAGPSLSPPPPKTWDDSPPRVSPSAANHYLASARTTSKESSPAFMTESRSQAQGPKPRMVTLFIEDRRHGTDELAEVHVPLRTIGEGYLWADARDVCAALQSGPSRIDGPAKVFTMRGKYRQIFLRISADGEETSQSANLKVETNRTLSIAVEGISDPRAGMPTQFFNANPSPLVNPGPTASLSNTAHLLTPVSTHLDLDGVHATSPSRNEERSGGARKRKRGTSLDHMQPFPLSSPRSRDLANTVDASRATRSPHGQYARPWKSRRSDPTLSFDGGYASDSPQAAYRSQRALRRDQIVSGSHMHVSGYETDQPTTSVRSRLSSGAMTAAPDHHQGSDRRVSSLLLQPPPTPVEGGSQRMRDKVVEFLRERFMEDASHWNEFTRDRSQVGSLSNAALLRVYWFAQDRLDASVGSRLPKHLNSNSKKVEIRDVIDALGITEDWYQECNETLSLVVAYGERGERGENARAVAACRDRAPKPHVGRVGGPTDLLLLLRQVHEEYCERVPRGRNGQSRD